MIKLLLKHTHIILKKLFNRNYFIGKCCIFCVSLCLFILPFTFTVHAQQGILQVVVSKLKTGDVLVKKEKNQWLIMHLLAIETFEQESSMGNVAMYQSDEKPSLDVLKTLQPTVSSLPIPLSSFEDESWILLGSSVVSQQKTENEASFKKQLKESIKVSY